MFRLKLSALYGVALLFAVAVAGCAGKAHTLKVAVGQFEVESIAAVNAIDDMHKEEIASAKRSPSAATNSFVDNVLKSTREATGERIEFWLNPQKVERKPETERAWADFIEHLRNQYFTFSRIFDQIEQASFTGRKVVQKSVPYIEKLIAQLAYFASSIDKNPPKFLDRRSALIVVLKNIRYGEADKEEKRRQIGEWRDKWLGLTAEEKELKRKTTEQCLIAVTIGLEIRKQMLAYNKVSLDDLSEAFTRILFVAGALTGKDFSSLQEKSERIVSEIENDPVWQRAASIALEEINKAMATRQE